MKIVATVTDVSSVVYAGGTPESVSAIIEIPDENVPDMLRRYFKDKEWASKDENRYSYAYLQFSLLEE